MNRIERFELIEEKIKLYRTSLIMLESKKRQLLKILDELKAERKNSEPGYNEKIRGLNNERNVVKAEISDLKTQVNNSYKKTEELIFEGIKESYTDVYDKHLSRLYNQKIEIIFKKIGDAFDIESCIANEVLVTHDKRQHLKILRTVSFGIRDIDNNRMIKRALVECCVYDKKKPAGTLIPFNVKGI